MALRKRKDDLGNMSRGSILCLCAPVRVSDQRTMTADPGGILEMGAAIDALPFRPERRLVCQGRVLCKYREEERLLWNECGLACSKGNIQVGLEPKEASNSLECSKHGVRQSKWEVRCDELSDLPLLSAWRSHLALN
jgi:hypothetical protein